MIEQIGVALPFTAFYTSLGVGTTGLTVTVDVFRNGSIIVTAAAASDAGDGLYTYTLAGASNTVEGVYAAVFKTATTSVDQQHLAGAWMVGKAGIEYLDASIAAVPTAAEIDTQLSGTHGAGTWGNGSGSTSTTVTVNDGVNPIDGVDVWVSTDSAGTNVIARGSTGALGTVVFMLDAGTYYAWKQLAGYDFTNPQSFTVS